MAALALALPGGATAQDAARDTAPPWVETIEGPQYFAVLVDDADRSARWYGRAFGLREVDRSRAEDGSWEIVNLSNDHLLVEIIRDDRVHPALEAGGFAKVGFHVPDVERVADRVGEATGERPRIVRFQDLYIAQIHDPDGNVIQLFTRVRR